MKKIPTFYFLYSFINCHMSYLAVGISILITLAYEKFNTCKICLFQAAVAYIKNSSLHPLNLIIFLAPPLNCVCVCGGGGGLYG